MQYSSTNAETNMPDYNGMPFYTLQAMTKSNALFEKLGLALQLIN